MRDEQDIRLNAETDARTNQVIPPLALPSTDLAGLAKLKARWASMPMTPRILLDRNEGVDNSWGGFDVRTLLRGEESGGRFTFHHMIVAPGAALPEHHLSDSDTYWYVQEGELELTVGACIERIGRHGFGYVPENVTQALRNVSGTPVQLFVWHSPAGPERAFELAHKAWLADRSTSGATYRQALSVLGFIFHAAGERRANDARTNAAASRLEAEVHTFADFAKLRARWGTRAPIPKIVEDRQKVGDIPMGGQDTKVLLSGDESSGRCVVFSYGIEPAYRAPPHHQPSEEEIFMIIDGTLRLTAGNATRDIPPGGFGYVPRYGTHGFVNVTDKLTRTVTLNSPAGHERGFEMVVRDAGSKDFPELLVAHGWHLHETYDPNAA